MKVLIVLTIFGFIIYVFFKLIAKYEDKDGFDTGCGCVAIVGTILITILGFIGMVKSCSNDSNHSPSYDYYDDARK